MKKTLALILAFALVFSTITVAFAEETMGTDAQVCADLGMLVGDGNGVTAAYLGTTPTRLQAAVMFLRLKGLEAEAKAFTGTENFADGNIAWAEGKAILSYLKANPQLGWVGDGVSFNPNGAMTAQAYYKVMLEALGYKQNTATVVGDFAYEGTIAFAASKGLTKVATVANFTVNDLAAATVEALKANVKGATTTLVASLVEAGKVEKAKAVAAGLIVEAPAAVAVAVDEVTAIGNTVVEVVFEDDVDAAAAGNVEGYSIEGLAISAAVVAGSDTVRLTTAAQTAGKLYTLVAGESKVKFSGCPKVTGAPEIDTVDSSDVEEVVVTFTKNMDFATATDVANYTIAGVEVVAAEVDGMEVTLTTKGLAARKQYTLKVKNVKSIDGVVLKSASENFYTKLDTTAPKFTSADGEVAVVAETNERIIVIFNEKVTKESAENVANYTIKTVTGDTTLEVLSATLKTSDGSTKERKVTLVTEPQTANKKYELSVLNVSDKTNAGNKITKAIKETFFGKKEDTKEPVFASAQAISRNLVKVKFTDDSMLDEASVLDVGNYTLKKASTEYTVEKAEKISSKNGEYVALLTVEDMPTGSYALTAEAIADEFTNELDKADKNFAVNTATYAASTVSAVEFEDEDGEVTGNHIKITFTKALNEASAEDIANYSIDEEIGTPVSATYDDASDVYTVVLKTNDLTEGVEYDITIDGVTDLAGNVLDLEVEDQVGTGWDDESVELEDSYSVDKYVVALAFDDAVADTCIDNVTLTLRDVEEEEDDVVLTAKALKDDDTVIEFSDFEGDVELVDNVTYFVYEISAGITDLAGNAFEIPDADDLEEFLVQGTDEDHEQVTIDTVEQIDGRTFKVTFSSNVLSVGDDDEYDLISGWLLDSEGTDGDDIVRFIKTSNLLDNPGEYDINISDYFTDEHGIAVLDDSEEAEDEGAVETTFYVEYEDDDAPYIVSVTAVDRTHIEVVYSERMRYMDNSGVATNYFASAFKVKNADSDVSKTEVTPATITLGSDKKTVTITLSDANALQSIYDYELIVKAVVKDVALNDAEEEVNDTFSFDGSDLAAHGL